MCTVALKHTAGGNHKFATDGDGLCTVYTDAVHVSQARLLRGRTVELGTPRMLWAVGWLHSLSTPYSLPPPRHLSHSLSLFGLCL